MSGKHLFLGGPLNGQFVVLRGEPGTFFAQSLVKFDLCPPTPGPVAEDRVMYSRQVLRDGPDTRYWVYTTGEASNGPIGAMLKLLEEWS